MSKFMSAVEKVDGIKNNIQKIIYFIVIPLLIVGLISGLIFGFKSCSNTETIEAQYFISDTVIVHENFEAKVTSAETINSINILDKNNNIISKTGKFIAVEVEIKQLENSTEEVHTFDANDFRLKDHTGVYIPLNKIMSFFDINAVDIHIDTDENGFIISDADFSGRYSIKDFTWINTQTTLGVTNTFTVYFEMDEGYRVENNIMIFEIDFYTGISGIKKGVDIVLVKCEEETIE